MYAPSKIILAHSARSRDRTYAEVLFMSTKVSNNYQVIQMVSKKYSKPRLNMHVRPFDRKNISITWETHGQYCFAFCKYLNDQYCEHLMSMCMCSRYDFLQNSTNLFTKKWDLLGFVDKWVYIWKISGLLFRFLDPIYLETFTGYISQFKTSAQRLMKNDIIIG